MGHRANARKTDPGCVRRHFKKRLSVKEPSISKYTNKLLAAVLFLSLVGMLMASLFYLMSGLSVTGSNNNDGEGAQVMFALCFISFLASAIALFWRLLGERALALLVARYRAQKARPPGYAWRCLVCQHTNPAGAQNCENCRNGPFLSVSQIQLARQRLGE